MTATARIVYYWAYPAIDQQSRHNMWEFMKDGRPDVRDAAGRAQPI